MFAHLTHESVRAEQRLREERLFEQALRQKGGLLRRFLRREVTPLRDYEAARAALESHHLYDRGTQTVCLDLIQGSVNRSTDFDASFHPLRQHIKERWMRVAHAFLTGATLPPVELIQVGEAYYVADGHHRISVARALGQHYIDATVRAMPA